jgi:hypothetical protein
LRTIDLRPTTSKHQVVPSSQAGIDGKADVADKKDVAITVRGFLPVRNAAYPTEPGRYGSAKGFSRTLAVLSETAPKRGRMKKLTRISANRTLGRSSG